MRHAIPTGWSTWSTEAAVRGTSTRVRCRASTEVVPDRVERERGRLAAELHQLEQVVFGVATVDRERAVGWILRCAEEGDARGRHPRVRGLEVVDLEAQMGEATRPRFSRGPGHLRLVEPEELEVSVGTPQVHGTTTGHR